MTITTAFCATAKSEFFSAAHCFNATVTPTGSVTSASATVTSVSSMTGVCVGMGVTGTGIPTGTVIAKIASGTSFVMSAAATATNTGVTLTTAGDAFYMALIVASPAGTYGAANVNYSDLTAIPGNNDEVVGGGYTAGGALLTNVSPVISGTTAYINFSPNPSWTSATFSTSGCMIYNSSVRLGGTSGSNTTGSGRSIGVFSFGGTQSVSVGTLTVLCPSPTATTAVFRLA